MKRISKKQQKRLRDRQPIIDALMRRCGGVCEICKQADNYFGLHPHHIVKLSQGGKDDLYNLLAVCSKCHDHSQYASGLPISQDWQLEIAKVLTDKFCEENADLWR